jgi:hypothetical protein
MLKNVLYFHKAVLKLTKNKLILNFSSATL